MEILPLLIIGGGPAGLTAGIYAGRSGVKTTIVAPLGGGLAASCDLIENFPGFPQGIPGAELVSLLKKQAEKFQVRIIYDQVQLVRKEDSVFLAEGNSIYRSQSLILATGAEPLKLGVPGEEKFRGKGVSYCATCDGAFFKDKVVSVIGGGDSALQEALYLGKLAKKVIIVHRRDKFRAIPYLQEKVLSQPNIALELNSSLLSINGSDKVEEILLKDNKSLQEKRLPVDGVFIYAGIKPNSELAKDLVEVDQTGAILTDELMQTKIKGLYACGDVRATPLRQIITACADGALAAFSAYHYLSDLSSLKS